eukprot:GHVT01088042.1.p1 GENE.GHVT01088042.1~~GHVT01088042.1.p1  ORF type:complete len:357 (+),score=78.44 GHVT01088042.1:824-1894(+)
MASSSHHSSGLRLGAVAGGGPKGPTGNLRMPPLAISPNLSIQAEAHGEKGVRKQMEDEHLVCPSLRAVSPQLPASLNMSVFGIFDGHGGRQSAAFVRSALPAELANQLMTLPEDVAQQHPLPDRVVREVLTNAFIKIDSRIATETPNCKDGCTAVVVALHGEMVYICNLGDAAAFLCKQEGVGSEQEEMHAVPLTEPHKCWVIAEKERIARFGGTIENGRINGQLEITRSFGDLPFKKFGVSCYPAIRKFRLAPSEDRFILLGCDGLWIALAAQDACQRTLDLLRKEQRRVALQKDADGVDLRRICKSLVEYVIYEKKSQDNVSALAIRFLPTNAKHSRDEASRKANLQEQRSSGK